MAQLKRMIEIGIDARGAKQGAKEVTQATQEITDSTSKANDELKRLDKTMAQMDASAQVAVQELVRLDGAFDVLGVETAIIGPNLQKISPALGQVTTQSKAAEAEIRKVGQAQQVVNEGSNDLAVSWGLLGRVGSQVKGLFAGIVGQIAALFAIKEVVHAMVTFEDEMARIATVTKLSGAAIDELGHNLEAISSRVPQNIEALAGVTRIAARIGVKGVADLTKFTDTVASLATAINMNPQELADTMGRVLKVAGENADNADKLGTAWLRLSRMANATASEVVQMTESVSRATALYKINSAESAALATAFSSVGLESRAGGMVLVQTLMEMQDALDHGGEKMRVLSVITGKTREELQATFKASAAQGFKVFVEGLGHVQAAGLNVNDVLGAMGLKNDMLLRTLPPLANNTKLLSDALQIAGDAMSGPSGLPTKFEKFSDLGKRIVNSLEAIINQAVKLSGVGPAIREVMKVLADGLGHIEGLSKALAAAGIGTAVYAVIAAAPAFAALITAIKNTTIVTKALNIVMAANPFGLIAIAIGTAVAALLYYKDTVVQVGDETATVGDLIVATFQEVGAQLVEAWQVVVDLFNDFWPWMKKTAHDVWQSIADTFVDLVNSMGLNWGKTWDGIKSVTKTAVNIVIGLIYGIGETIGIIAKRVASFFSAFSQLKFGSFDEFKTSLKAMSQDMATALAPGDIWKEVKDAWVENFNRDFVGDMAVALDDLSKDWKRVLKETFGDDSFIGQFGQNVVDQVDTMAKNVVARAVAMKRARDKAMAKDYESSSEFVGPQPLNGVAAAAGQADELRAGLHGVSDKSTDARKELDRMFTEIDQEVGVLTSFVGETRDLATAMDLAKARTEALKVAEDAYGQGTAEAYQTVDDYIKKLKELAQVRRQSQGFQDMVDANKSITDQFKILRMVREERVHGTEIIKYHTAAEDAYGKETEAAAAATEEFIKQLKELDRQAGLVKLADDIGNAFAGAFEDIIFKTKSVREALESLVRDTARLIFQELVSKQIANFVSNAAQSFMGGIGAFGSGGGGGGYSGFGNLGGNTYAAMGRVFNADRVFPFESGGIIGSQMRFPLNGGRDVGIAGEGNKPEWAIAPLERTPDGRLGAHVKVSDQRDRQEVKQVNVKMTVNTRDARSFMESSGQVTRAAAAMIRRAM